MHCELVEHGPVVAIVRVECDRAVEPGFRLLDLSVVPEELRHLGARARSADPLHGPCTRVESPHAENVEPHEPTGPSEHARAPCGTVAITIGSFSHFLSASTDLALRWNGPCLKSRDKAITSCRWCSVARIIEVRNAWLVKHYLRPWLHLNRLRPQQPRFGTLVHPLHPAPCYTKLVTGCGAVICAVRRDIPAPWRAAARRSSRCRP